MPSYSTVVASLAQRAREEDCGHKAQRRIRSLACPSSEQRKAGRMQRPRDGAQLFCDTQEYIRELTQVLMLRHP